jgi:RPA family protein
MKLRSFLAIAALCALTFSACEEVEQQEEATLTVNPSELLFDATGEPSQVVRLHATRDWRVSGSVPEWIALSKSGGSPGDYDIEISLEPNRENNREAEILFTIGLYNAAVTVQQSGDQGEVVYEQITCKEFLDKADTNTVYRLVGTVTNFNTKYCSFYLSDGTGTVNVYEVNNKAEWADVIKNMGTVTVRGKYKLYTGTNGTASPEMVAAYIEDFVPGNDGTPKGSGTKEDPYNPAGIAQAVKDLIWTSTTEYDSTDPVFVKGKVAVISEEFSTQFGNASFTLVDAEDGSGSFVAYRVLYVGNRKFTANDTQIKVGDVAVVYGKMMNYQNTTAETASGAFVYELNGVSDGGIVEEGTPEGDGSLESPFNASAAAQAVAGLTWTSTTEYQKVGPFYIKGKISKIGEAYSSQFGNATFTITDMDGRGSFEAYRVKYLGNSGFSSDDEQIKVGDEVIIYGEIMNYRGTTPESVSGSYLYSLNGKVKDMGTAQGSGTLEDPFNPAGANAAAARLGWTDKDNYETLDNVYIKGKISKIANNGTYTDGGTFGNASFYITDIETETGEFYVYRALYLKNKKFESGQTDIKVGDEVIVCGSIMNYQGKTPESVAGQAYLYELNGDQGEDTPVGTAKGTGTLEDPYNPAGAAAAAATLTWTDNNTYQTVEDVYIKGKISKIPDKGTYTEGGTYGNASFYLVDSEDETGEFYVFRALYLKNKKFAEGQTDIKVGDEVIVFGSIMNYRGNTPETVAGKAYLFELNGDRGEDTPAIDYENSPEKSISDFIAAADTKNYYKLTGTVSNFNANFCSMDIADETGASIYVYSVINKDEWASKITNGGTIVLAGKYAYYESKQQHEVVDAYILDFIGSPAPPVTPKGTGTLEDPYNPAGAAAVASQLTWTDNATYQTVENVYIKGKISSIANKGTYTDGGTYGNASFYIVDSEDGTGEFYVYRALYLENKKFESGQTDIKVGDEVVVFGNIMNFQGKTPETVSGKAYLYSLNGKTKPDPTPVIDYENAPEKSISDFITAADTENYYKLTGTVSNFNANFCSMDITDETGASIYVYSVANKDAWASKITNGGTVVLAGKYLYYASKQQHEVVDAYILDFIGAPAPPVTLKGTGTLEDPYNPAAAAAAVADFTWTSNTEYQKTENDVYIKGKISNIPSKGTYTESGTYGNGSFYLVDTEDGTGEFYVFRALYLGNVKYTVGQTDIKVGDEVVVCGKIMNYQGKTPETVSGEAYLYSLNGSTESVIVPAFGVANTSISVPASATSAVISITGNSPWTILGDGLQFSATEGEGASDVTVYFPANESEEQENVYTLYVSTSAQVESPRITVVITQAKKAAAGSVNVYTKVTGALDSYEGRYLIVYESSKVAFDGSLERLDAVGNTKEVTIENGSISIAPDEDTFYFTIAKSGTGYTIQSQSGYYIYQTSDANGLGSAKTAGSVVNNISVSNGDASIEASGAHLRYNATSNQLRFRYYKSATYTQQKAIQLYKLAE